MRHSVNGVHHPEAHLFKGSLHLAWPKGAKVAATAGAAAVALMSGQRRKVCSTNDLLSEGDDHRQCLVLQKIGNHCTNAQGSGGGESWGMGFYKHLER